MFSPRKVAGAFGALILVVLASVILAPGRPTPVQAASLSVTGGQSSVTVTLTGVLSGELITVCATGGPTPCPGVPTPTGGGTGTFNSVSPANCGLALAGGGQQNFVTFTSTCTGSITLTWQCLTSGTITFTLQSSITPQDQRDQTCNLATGGGNSSILPGGTVCTGGACVNLVANPNVVSCKGGSTTVTAFANYQFPQVIPLTPVTTQPNGLPAAQQPYFFFTVSKGVAQIQQTSNNTAVVTLLEGMPESEITATTGGVTGTIKIFPYCRPGTAGVSASPTAGGTPGAGGGLPAPAATPIPTVPIGSLTITASPGVIETCDGSVFLSATVKDTNGKLVPDGTNVLFIATKGILDPASANTTQGTANVVYTSDLKAPGSVKLSAQSGPAFATVDVPVLCGTSGSGAGALGSSSAGSPGFRPPNTGDGRAASITIRPPSTGNAGLMPPARGWSRGLLLARLGNLVDGPIEAYQ